MELLGEALEVTVMKGRNHTKLTEDHVRFIRQKASEGVSDREIHRTWFNHLNASTISAARRGETWADIDGALPDHATLSAAHRVARRDGLIHALSMVDNQIDRALASGFSRTSSYVEGLRENRRKLTAEQIDLEDMMRKRGEL